MTTTLTARPPSPSPPPSLSPSQLPPVPASPTYSYASMSTSATTAAPSNITMSSYNLPLPPPPPPTAHAVLTKSDLAASQAAYASLLTTAKAYRLALAALSTAASAFGSALESCARLKEARADSLSLPGAHPLHHQPPQPTTSSHCTADSLLAAAGVQHLVANHQQILSETVYRAFEVPLLHELDKWRRAVDDEQTRYRAAVHTQSAAIRALERDGLRLHKQRGPRDVAPFRRHLVALTAQLDGLTALHATHAHTLLRESQDSSAKILDASCSLVRAEVDIFESLARKGWAGGGLDDLLEKGTDLFAPADEDHYYHHNQHDADEYYHPHHGGGGDSEAGAKLFSILPPRSILADTTDEMLRGRSPHTRADSLGVAVAEPYQSLAGAVGISPVRGRGRGRDETASLFSADFHVSGGGGHRPPRMTRPFSPQPVRVAPEDVMGSEGPPPPTAAAAAAAAGSEEEGSSDDGDEDDGLPSSPETVRDDGFGGGGVGVEGEGGEDEHPWDSEGEEGKRMSTAASDPEERERRWQAAVSDAEETTV